MESITVYLSKQRKSVLIVWGLILVLLVGLIDYQTGTEISFSIFYVFPISLLTWFGGRWAGIWVAIASAATWLVADLIGGATYSNPIIPYWNAIVRFGFFLFITFLLSAWKKLNEGLEDMVEEKTTALKAESLERKQLEAQFLQAQKMESVGRLAGGVAHDFNNLLTAMLGYATLALGAIPPDNPARLHVHQVQRAANRAASLTHQLLAFARRQIIEPRVTNLNHLILDMDKMLRRLIGEDIELLTLVARDLWAVKVDPSQIEQVLVNLAVNARDAMSEGGRLTIETANVTLGSDYARSHAEVSPGEYVMLAVSDTGLGMTEEVKAHLFEPFFTTKEQGKGTGLGLATCYGLVKQSGGHIWVYSEVGKGTTFKIYLPRVEEAVSGLPQHEAAAPPRRGTETVLLVEDEPSVREVAAHVLRDQGYRVLEAANGDEAFRLAQEYANQEIHLLLADVVLPQMGGRELADRLKALRPDIKVLFISGYTDNAIVHHGALEAGVAFLQKPFSPTALARKVREVLDK